MNTDELLATLTSAQRMELDADLEAIAANTIAAYKKNPEQFARGNYALHLKGEIYLNVNISLYLGDKDRLYPVIESVERLASLDEYLAAINSQPAVKNSTK